MKLSRFAGDRETEKRSCGRCVTVLPGRRADPSRWYRDAWSRRQTARRRRRTASQVSTDHWTWSTPGSHLRTPINQSINQSVDVHLLKVNDKKKLSFCSPIHIHSVYINFYFLSFFIHCIFFYGSCGLIQIKMMMIMTILSTFDRKSVLRIKYACDTLFIRYLFCTTESMVYDKLYKNNYLSLLV